MSIPSQIVVVSLSALLSVVGLGAESSAQAASITPTAKVRGAAAQKASGGMSNFMINGHFGQYAATDCAHLQVTFWDTFKFFGYANPKYRVYRDGVLVATLNGGGYFGVGTVDEFKEISLPPGDGTYWVARSGAGFGSTYTPAIHVSYPAGPCNSGGWELEWQLAQWNDPLADPYRYPGDFDGDGADEILAATGATGTADWMTMYSYEGGVWQWDWSNYGDPAAGNGIYAYRGKLVVGDFDGDGKDELMGVPVGGWVTLFDYENGDWHWTWSNYGSASAGNGIADYASNLVAGDYDGDGRDELLGSPVGGWKTMFTYENGDWQWSWSNYGDPALGISAYDRLIAFDLDGDGDDEVLGLDGWATTFDFDGTEFHWLWSTNGASSLGGWPYPLAETDVILAGNIDGDSRDELIFLQRGQAAGGAMSMDFENGVPNQNWSNSASPTTIADWVLGSLWPTSYQLVKAKAGQPAFLLAGRFAWGAWDVRMYETLSGGNY